MSPRRRPPPRPPVRPDPATARRPIGDAVDAVERTIHLLSLGLDGLEARAGYSLIEPHVDIAPLAWLAAELEAQQGALRARLSAGPRPPHSGARRPRRPTPWPNRLPPPAELRDPDRR
jgi:hypothetical protein